MKTSKYTISTNKLRSRVFKAMWTIIRKDININLSEALKKAWVWAKSKFSKKEDPKTEKMNFTANDRHFDIVVTFDNNNTITDMTVIRDGQDISKMILSSQYDKHYQNFKQYC